MRTVGSLRKARRRGAERVGWFPFVAAACLVRLPKLLAGSGKTAAQSGISGRKYAQQLAKHRQAV